MHLFNGLATTSSLIAGVNSRFNPFPGRGYMIGCHASGMLCSRLAGVSELNTPLSNCEAPVCCALFSFCCFIRGVRSRPRATSLRASVRSLPHIPHHPSRTHPFGGRGESGYVSLWLQGVSIWLPGFNQQIGNPSFFPSWSVAARNLFPPHT